MRLRSRFAALTAAFLLAWTLFGCADSSGAGEAAGSVPAAASRGLEVSSFEEALLSDEGVSVEPPAQAVRLAEIYDRYCSGADFSGVQDASKVCELGAAVLCSFGLAEDYLVPEEESFNFPPERLYSTGAFFMNSAGEAGSLEGCAWRYDSSYLGLDLQLRAQAAQRFPNGELRIAFSRQNGELPLNSAVYTFQEAAAGSVPDGLSEFVTEGETYYTLSSVENQFVDPNPVPVTIEIGSVGDLLAAAEEINASAAHTGNVYRLTADLDLSGVDFTPLGLCERVTYQDDERDSTLPGFNGSFEGQGHVIRKLRLSYPVGERVQNAGLFACIGRMGSVRDLILEDADVWADGNFSNVGLLAGVCEGSVENVRVSGSVTGGCCVGGLIGQAGSTDSAPYLSGCTVSAEVSGSSDVGGLIGTVYNGLLLDCAAEGSVTARRDDRIPLAPPGTPFCVGGFAGSGFFTQFMDCRCAVSLRILDTGSWIGAFAGGIYDGGAEGCTYAASLAGAWDVIDVINDRHADDYTGYDITANQ